MATGRARLRVPAKAAKGEAITIKTMISHPMERGERKDPATGAVVPRRIINRFVASYNGEEVFSADWHTSISADPYLAFTVVATESGTIVLTWHDDDGSVFSEQATITVDEGGAGTWR